ncbi:hypothetical protein LSTR_LSTR007904 [Laodelphax striatellus]|uniref:Single domain-containing protein n=1 Tax=Laodelphax striatellus TaxID=195883 RepID=A0A482XMA2_LAOST|nr:hypothetical protein LSTR_LSTR007904 [Laodelphax striatellus]
MKSVCAFFVAAIIASMLIAAYDAAVAIEVQKGKCGKCVHNGKTYPQGAIWQEKGKCEQLLCGRYNETHVKIEYQSCGAIGVGEGYVLVKGNPDLKYPDCCPKAVPIKQQPHHDHHHNHHNHD